MNLKLQNKVVLVTGGASGIGAAICRLLEQEGAVPVIIDLTKGEYFTVQMDLSVEGAPEIALGVVLKKYGRLDGLVNNAGVNDGVSLEHGTYEAFMYSLRRNALHYQELMRLCMQPLMVSGGAVVNIISKTAFTGQGGTSGYAAANGVREALTTGGCEELRYSGIRVNGVVVAECLTPQYLDWLGTGEQARVAMEEIKSRIPLGHRLTTPYEVACMAVYLLSPASGGVSGELLFVDGGYVHLDRGARAGARAGAGGKELLP